MAIDYDDLMQSGATGLGARYDEKDVMLYALGVGMGRDPLDEKELPFVYENNGVKVVPTFASVINRGEAPAERQRMPQKSQINFALVVDGERRITFHKPLPPRCEILADERYLDILDKGEGKGAVLIQERVVREAASNDKLFTIVSSIFARGDGGFGGKSQGGPQLHPIPERAPDLVKECDTRPDQAFLYALCGDRNPLHRDPAFARTVGFPRPILHGLCTYGITCRAVLQEITNWDADRIASHQARFSAPVFPGDTITVDLWSDGKAISFEARVKAREATVIKNGLTMLRS